MSPTTSNLRFPSYLMGIYVFCPTEKGHCLTLSYKPVPPLSFKKRSKFFNQKKMYTDAVSFKAGHFHWVFHIGWPTSATAAHCKTNTFLNKNLLSLWNCSYCFITWNLQLPCIFVTAFSQTSLLLVWIYRELRLPTREHRPTKISAWLISNFTR